MDYGFEFQGRVYTPNQTAVDPADSATRNAAIDAAELARIAQAPESVVCYYKAELFRSAAGDAVPSGRGRNCPLIRTCALTTWMGADLGAIAVEATVYRHNFGGRMIAISATIAGKRYHGRASYDWGTVIRMRRARD